MDKTAEFMGIEIKEDEQVGINKGQLRQLIIETLREINMCSPAAVNLLMGTAAQESNMGEYIKQIHGPALGIFQLEPKTCLDIEKYLQYKPKLYGYVLDNTAACSPGELSWNLKFAIIMCRYHYWRVPEKLPEFYNTWGMALYWKKYYNSSIGRGTVAEFVANYERYVM